MRTRRLLHARSRQHLSLLYGTAETNPERTASYAGENRDPSQPAPGQASPCGQVIVAISPAGAELRGSAVPMPELIRVLTNVLGRIVVDKTGFARTFDVHLEFTADEALGGLPAPPPPAAGGDPDIHGNIFAAIQDQLGLKLESAKGPVDVVVIDSVERPVAN
ncbi:MAG: TIGR03435 family protein [Acidobacteriota bacterium]|nr:TIGR03435 family protein [Acidobacteriota bacterium]